ncbi:MAG TPA: HEXXH motif-containing putative peptide modification protein [Acidobacteriota bacterium]|nr:HEXXH motif-containing putative peptide modification protein [Acidobacteriota bacterium]
MLESIYRGLSHPGLPLDPTILDAITSEHARGVVETFLNRFDSTLEQSGDGLASCLTGWLEHNAALHDVWNTSFGAVERLASSEDPSASNVLFSAAQLALSMMAAGLEGRFQVKFEDPVRLRFDRWCLPAATGVAAECGRGSVDIRLGDTGVRPLALRRPSGSAWRLERSGGGLEELTQVQMGDNQVTFLSDSVFEGGYDLNFPFPIDASGEKTAAAWRAAFQLLGEQAPEYLDWVDRVIQDIIPLKVPNQAMVSGSHNMHWGEVFMTSILEPLKFAEMLVHESSHQYYLIGCMLSNVEDGSDRKLYYSPAKKKERPLDKILLAYHAFANVILMYRRCREAGLETRAEEAKLLPEVEELEKPLRQTRGLTELGVSLWRPLAQRLEESS